MKRKITIAILLTLIILMLSPLTARVGRWQMVHEWKSPVGIYGFEHPLTLTAEEFNAFVDPLKLYQEHRIVVTDGGYSYLVETKFNFYAEIAEAQVEWNEHGVSFSHPSWIKITIPKDRIISQVGN